MDQAREKILMKEFGEKLKKFRNDRNLSVRALADLADMDYTNISNIENGHSNPSMTTVIFLAEALNVAPSELLPSIKKG
jgi:transcriptional regulator with XRE-family HTH domain